MVEFKLLDYSNRKVALTTNLIESVIENLDETTTIKMASGQAWNVIGTYEQICEAIGRAFEQNQPDNTVKDQGLDSFKPIQDDNFLNACNEIG